MPSIARLYESEDKARETARKLEAEDFDEIIVLSPGGDASALRKTSLNEADAEFYARRVQTGRALVVVNATFGRGSVAKGILDDAGPVDTELETPSAGAQSNSRTPLSDFLGWKPLSTRRYFMMSRAELTTTQGPTFSRSFGMGLLTKGSTPFSSMFGMKLLVSPPSKKESSFGMPLLTKNSTPLSSAIGWKPLISKRTPLSSAIGWSPLTSRQSKSR